MGNVSAEMAKGREKISQLLLDKVEDMLDYLYERWQDEKEYEDFSDYEKVMRDAVGDGFIKATKRPFGFITQIEGFPYKSHVSINYQCISCKAIN